MLLLCLGHVPTVVVCSVAAAQEVMQVRVMSFAGRPVSAFLYCAATSRSHHKYWRQARHVCIVQLLGAHRVGPFRRVQEQEPVVLAGHVARADGDGGAAADLSEILTEYANAVVVVTGDASARGLFDDGGSGHRQSNVLLDVHENDKEHGTQLEINEIKAIILTNIIISIHESILYIFRI